MNCDLCEQEPAKVMISNTDNGDTLAVGGACLPGWCLAMIAADFQARGVSPEDTVTDVTNAMRAVAGAPAAGAGAPEAVGVRDVSPSGVGTTAVDDGPAGLLPEQTEEMTV